MRNIGLWSLTLLSAFSFTGACANATGETDLTGGSSSTGGGTASGSTSASGSSTSTGGLTGTGGASLTGGSTATGGTPATGGSVATGGAPSTGGVPTTCTDGDTEDCSIHAPSTPAGDATCVDGDWDTSACMVCEPNATDIDCTTIVGGAEDYNGGVASCDAAGEVIDESGCFYCGDDVVNGMGEECDGADVPSMSCSDVGLPDGDSGGADLDCLNNTCQFDRSVCSVCTVPYIDDCLEGNPTSCTGSACVDQQCGAQSTCDMTCGWQTNCTGMSCNVGATCNVTCGGGKAACDIDCLPGSNCNLDTTDSWEAQPQGTLNCAKDGVCTYNFAGGPTMPTTGLTINCEDGSDCTVNSSKSGQTISGLVCKSNSKCTIVANLSDSTVNYVCEADADCSCSASGHNGACNCTGAGCPVP